MVGNWKPCISFFFIVRSREQAFDLLESRFGKWNPVCFLLSGNSDRRKYTDSAEYLRPFRSSRTCKVQNLFNIWVIYLWRSYFKNKFSNRYSQTADFEDYSLQPCHDICCGKYLLIFRKEVLPPSSGYESKSIYPKYIGSTFWEISV